MKLHEVSRHWADFNSAKAFLREKGVLRRQIPRCNVCDRLMTEVKCGRGEERVWRCPSHNGMKVSLRDGSFLQYQGMSLPEFIMVVYVWAHEIPVTTTVEMVGLSPATTIKWYSYLREVCSNRLVTHPVTEESVMAKEGKNHKDEFMWRQQYGRTHSDAFENILLHISQWYVTPRVHYIEMGNSAISMLWTLLMTSKSGTHNIGADYWKSQPRKFCEFCKCWLTDNKPSIEFHEKGKQHQENVRKKIEKDKTEEEKEESDVIVKLEPEDDSEVDAVFEGPLPRNADTDNRTRKAYEEWVTHEEEAPVDYELPEVPTKDIPRQDFYEEEPVKFNEKHVTSLSHSDDVTAVAFKKCKVTKGARNMHSRDDSDD